MSQQYSKEEFTAQYDAIAASARSNTTPIYITDESGTPDLVVLSVKTYSELAAASAIGAFLSAAPEQTEKHPSVDVLAELEKQK